MILKLLGVVLFVLFNGFVFAQDAGLQSIVDYKVHKMARELKLSDAQLFAIKPIIHDYLVKRVAVLQESSQEGIIDHGSLKSTLQALKNNEYQKLSKVLNEDQMKKLVNKEHLMAALNPDNQESAAEEDVSLTPSGANFKF